MPPRPAGTDGRDHAYRMVIENRYQRMADFKQSIERVMMLHFVFVLLKVGWAMACTHVDSSLAVPRATQGLVAGEVLLYMLYNMAKLGTAKESLAILKTWNIVQVCTCSISVLSSWLYHQGTNTGGEPTYEYSHAMAAHLSGLLPAYSPRTLLDACKAAELFQDVTLTAFLAMGTFIAHKMITEKMEMKKEKANASAPRAGAQKGRGSDDDDDDDAPAAVPLKQGGDGGEPKAAKAASSGKSLRRRA